MKGCVGDMSSVNNSGSGIQYMQTNGRLGFGIELTPIRRRDCCKFGTDKPTGNRTRDLEVSEANALVIGIIFAC